MWQREHGALQIWPHPAHHMTDTSNHCLEHQSMNQAQQTDALLDSHEAGIEATDLCSSLDDVEKA
jgi:hypothetical protein